MKIGLTYDLREDYLALGYSELETAEFDRPDTIEALEASIRRLGMETERIGNVYALAQKLIEGQKWDLVFNIAEGMHGMGREALVPALLDAYRIPYTFSDPAVLALSLNKAMTKRVVRDLGVSTPDFAVIETPDDLRHVNLPYPLFVKPLAEGTGKGITADCRVSTPAELSALCQRLLEQYKQPVLVEAFLPGRELTVGITGTGRAAKALGVLEVVFLPAAEAHAYSYLNKEKCEELVEYRLCPDEPLASQCRELALRVWLGLGCKDAGRVDIRTDAEGKPCFLEINPLAGLNPVHSDLPILCSHVGISFDALIGEIVYSALSRI